MSNISIPKIIHYCWFGRNKKPALIRKCIRSWKKYCPDYQFIEWNEDNFDIDSLPYCRQAYDAKKWAFVTDYVRLKVVYEHGGIYMDTDVELVKPLDDYLHYPCFMGFQHESYVNTGLIFGAEKNHGFVAENADVYHEADFQKQLLAGKPIICQEYTTALLEKKGLIVPCTGGIQRIGDITVFPPEYFCPLSNRTGILNKTENTVAIHHFAGSWQSETWKQAFRDLKRNRIQHEITHLPNRILLTILGSGRYEDLKRRLKK